MAVQEIRINDKISYIKASENPLSADIGIIRDNGTTWLFDVGDGENKVPLLQEGYHVVLSHFHQDHTGNIGKLPITQLFVSKETGKHIPGGTIVSESLEIGDLHIFPLPSSHAKGCLGLEVDHEYAFVGDALYCRRKNGYYGYNAQLLKEEIAVLKSLQAPFLLVSHHEGLIRKKEEVLEELEEIYAMRVPGEPEIQLTAGNEAAE